MADGQLESGTIAETAQFGADDRSILDLVHESIFVRGRDLCIRYWNAAAEELYGWTREEALGKNVLDLLNCGHEMSLEQCEAELFRTGRWQGELSRTTKSGSSLIVEVVWAVRRDADGEPVEIIETGRDLTRRREREAALKVNEARYRNLFDAMAVSFWEVDFNAVGAILLEILKDATIDQLRDRLASDRELVRRCMESARVLNVNTKTVDLFGADERDELVGGNVSRFWPIESEAVFNEALLSTMERRPHLITETQLLDVSGQPFDVLFTVAWSPESRRDGVLVLGIVDISDRKRAYRDLAASELRYRSIFNSMPMSFWQLDTGALRAALDTLRCQGVASIADHAAANPGFVDQALAMVRITDVNEETIRMMGATDRQQLLGTMADFWTDRAGFIRSIDARFHGAQSFGQISQIATLDGRVIEILWKTVFTDELAAGGLTLTGAIDITDRTRAVRALAESERKYRDLYNYMPIALWQLDSRDMKVMFDALRDQGVEDLLGYVRDHPEFLDRAQSTLKIMEANDQTLELFGAKDRQQLLDWMPLNWVTREDWAGAAMARLSGAHHYVSESTLRRMDGKLIDVLFSVAFANPQDPQSVNLVGAVDISDRTAAQRQLRRLEMEFAHAARVATLGELTASIAHEVNQPLAAIATNGEATLRWLNRDEPNTDEVRSLAARVVSDARRAADIIAHIRAMASKQAPDHQAIDVNALVAETSQFLRNEMDSHGIITKQELGSSLPLAICDRTQIQQVIVNLAMNAVHAMAASIRPQKMLVLRTMRRGGFIVVQVEDNGPGIGDHILPRLFDSFFTTRDEGLGIGLSICRSIIESHGGVIGATNLPSGARFEFTLPALS